MTESAAEKRSCCCLLQIPILMKNIEGCIGILSKTRTSTYRWEYVNAVRKGRHRLIKVINLIKQEHGRKRPISSKEDIHREIFEADMETELEEIKINHLRKEWIRQQDTMAKLQETLFRKRRLLSMHSNYCSSQGSALCSILATVMVNDHLTRSFLENQGAYLVSFVKIADGCLSSFTRTYCQEAPIEDSTDYKYVLALYECLAYVSATPEGRKFLVTSEECQTMLRELIQNLPRVTYATTEKLKLNLLKILYDVASEDDGQNFLYGTGSSLLPTLSKCLVQKYNAVSYKYVLEILARLTKEIHCRHYLELITASVNTERLKDLSGSMYREVNYLARRTLQNITRAASYLPAFDETPAAGDTAAEEVACSCRKCRKIVEKTRSDRHLQNTSTKQIFRIPGKSKRARIKTVQRFRSEATPSSYSSCTIAISTSSAASESLGRRSQAESSPYCSAFCVKAFEVAPATLTKKCSSPSRLTTKSSKCKQKCSSKKRCSSAPSSKVRLEAGGNMSSSSSRRNNQPKCSSLTARQKPPRVATPSRSSSQEMPQISPGSTCTCSSWARFPLNFLTQKNSSSYCAFTDHILPKPIGTPSSFSLDARESRRSNARGGGGNPPCTCSCVSERRVVPYDPQQAMLAATLRPTDRRMDAAGSQKKTVRITSRIVGKRRPNARIERVVTKIRVPGLPFKGLTRH